MKIALLLVVSCLALTGSLDCFAEIPKNAGLLEPADYFRVEHVTQLALSSDGKMLAYVVRDGDLLAFYSDKLSTDEKRKTTQVWLRLLESNVKPIVLDKLADAQEIAWIPGTHVLAFLSPRSNGVSQIFTFDNATHKLTQITHSVDPVEKFRFAADGATLAYTTRPRIKPGASLYERFRHDDKGIVIDMDSFGLFDFLSPDWNAQLQPAPADLWVIRGEGPAVKVPLPGGAGKNFFWSSDAQFLSITYISPNLSLLGAALLRTSLGVFDVDFGKFQVLGEGADPVKAQPGLRFGGGEWIPGTHALFVRRVTETDPWVSPSYPDWTVAPISAGLPSAPIRWRPVATYGSGTKFWPIGANQMLMESTVNGVHSLFDLDRNGIRRSELVAGLDGSSSLFTFSADRKTISFINESLTRPPEIYVRKGSSPAQRLTHFNNAVAARVHYTAREVNWKSVDGVTARGWLLEPAGSKASQKPWPMVTFVHGGPGFVMTDTFAPYFSMWPYPFEVMASHGIAVFMPNYRGTQTYGKAFASPKRQSAEPVDDILTGVKSLVASGVADPKRLGISGHSHGGWLGPMVVARDKKRFAVGSFAEGWANEVTLYELLPRDANRQIHDPLMGGGLSLYDSPQRYIEDSPDLNFKGVFTAMLFEAGAQSSGGGLFMLGFSKAAQHFGIPSEYVVYPKTGHNPSLPEIQHESAERNLDWFRFWLQGYEDPDQAKRAQYAHWREMKKTVSAQPTHIAGKADRQGL